MSSNPMLETKGFDVDKFAESVAAALKYAVICCPNCEHFENNKEPGKEKCGLNNLHPPAKIIAFGCEMFLEQQVPF